MNPARIYLSRPVKVNTVKKLLLLIFLALASCSEYGRRLEFNNGEVFYTREIRYNEALATGRMLMKNNMYFDGRPKSVQLDKAEGRYIFRVVDPADPGTTKPYQSLAWLLSRNIFHAPVDVEICDREFRALRKIPFTEPSE